MPLGSVNPIHLFLLLHTHTSRNLDLSDTVCSAGSLTFTLATSHQTPMGGVTATTFVRALLTVSVRDVLTLCIN